MPFFMQALYVLVVFTSVLLFWTRLKQGYIKCSSTTIIWKNDIEVYVKSLSYSQ